MRAGNLYLTAQDAIALALENNIDIEVARYGPLHAAWQLERAQAGGALPGRAGGASQAGSVASGLKVLQTARPLPVSRSLAPGRNSNQTANASISQVGPVTQNWTRRSGNLHLQPHDHSAAKQYSEHSAGSHLEYAGQQCLLSARLSDGRRGDRELQRPLPE